VGEKGSANLPRGVTVRTHKSGATINISFTYKGVKCREPLSNIEVSSKNIKYAERLLGEIHNKIERGIFNYPDHFPNSTRLKLFGNSQSNKSVKDYLDEYIELCVSRELSPSTLTGYKKCATALSSLHKLHVTELSPAILKNWIQQQNTTLKTTRNRLSLLRSAIDEAVTDGLLKSNPVALVSASRYRNENITNESTYTVDPLSPKEVDAILLAAGNVQLENLIRFAFHTGMRGSELCALRWEDIDIINNTAHVQTASVEGVTKGTKTKAGKRKIELDSEALQALKKQKPFSFFHSPFIFLDPKMNKPWANAEAIRKKAWIPTLKKAGVRYRNTYQTRHTFATMHISRGANLFWLAQQMGHRGPEMLFRHYGSYLNEYSELSNNIILRNILND
jgi:integrase